jgi:succinate dehydrogenase / fumarate reductase membrane anchor subunit
MNETRNWTWHIITAGVILVFLGLHMSIMHLDNLAGWFSTTEGTLNWTNVLARSKDAFFAITYIVLLAAALYHGLYGLRNILFELSIGPSGQKLVNSMFWIVGVCLFAAGSLATIFTFRM